MRNFLTFLLFVASYSVIAQEWTLLTPLRTTSDVRGCSFMDDLNGYAVATTDGSILKTTDGGITWKRVWTGGASSLYNVYMMSTDTIFVCGSGGLLNRSIDGGNSWQDMNPPTTEILYDITFIDSEIGFACGFNGVMLRTTNTGSTWTSIPSGTTNRLWDLDFVNDSVGYACGWFGTILKTTDAGLTGNSVAPVKTVSFQSVHFLDELVGYACGSATTIMKTTDGGLNWTTQLTTGSEGLNYICFRSATHGWAVGTWGAFYTTNNGGTTWTSQAILGNGTGAHFYCGAYLSNSAAYIMGTQFIYKSTDNGATWAILKNGVPRSKYNALYFWNDNTGTLAGASGLAGEGSPQSGIVHTTDGGQTWEVQQQGGSGWYGLHFPSQNVGYVIGNGTLAKTTDGGGQWLTVNNNLGLSGMAVWFLNDNTGFAGGDGLYNNICKTTNGGTTFSCGTNLSAGDFYFVNDSLGYSIFSSGMSSTIFKTIDAGENWQYLDTGGGGHSSLYFINENEGWVGGIDHTYHTTDGGLSWTSQLVEFSGYAIVGVHFYTAELGFCVTQNGILYKTADGGETWEMIVGNFNSMSPVLNAWFTENYVYVGCYQGDVFKTELGCGEFELGALLGPNSWCEGESGNVIAEVVPGGTYSWTFPEGWSSESTTSVAQFVVGEASGLINLEVTNACGLTATANYAMTVTPQVQQPILIEGNSSICGEGNFVFSIPEDIYADNYEWQWSSQFQAFANDNLLTVSAASGNGIISVQTSNECGMSEIISLNVTVPTSQLPGDINGDCAVNISDLEILLGNYGCQFSCVESDLDGDGVVGMGDMILMIGLVE